MLDKVIHNKTLFFIVHVIIGFLATQSFFPSIYGLLIIGIPVLILIYTKNQNEEALMFSAYLVGAEVFCRMTNSFILYETGKYGVILFLILGVFLGRYKQKFSVQFVFYLLLLALGIVFTQVPEGESIRNAIVFNLSGPLVLGIAAIYFYKRPISKKDITNALFFMLLPIVSMVTYLYFRTPNIEEIVFGGTANFDTSGGFGPNQVATEIGLGIFIITAFILMKKTFSGFKILDAIILFYFVYRGLLTFSRGGIFTGAICIICFAFFYLLYKNGTIQIFLKYIVTGAVFIVAIWIYTSNITGGMLDNRYAGKNTKGVKKEDITSGRADLLNNQLRNFYTNPMGIGVGNGRFERERSGDNITAASHNEVGRLIEEHGLIGLIILIGLLAAPLLTFLYSNNYQRAFTITFYLFWLLTINHSAMRIAFPGFIYALCFINIIPDEKE